ncbi:phosphorylase superfamily protein [Bradyrhizobium sp. R2.2-H]|nr:phosphorylase superfamily protein [Bradyrhizobium sp. Y-H1]TCU77654.1 phosphorylase superfamily protein [Bradyrhizobium sp. R2.2-H]
MTQLVDVGILTIRDDEFTAVLQAFPDDHRIHKSRHREYTLRSAGAGEGRRYRLAILRQLEQGNGEAQEAARDLYDDLQPALILVVGIAGGLPSDDVTLGDVVISTRIHDFSIEARRFEEWPTYNVGGGPIDRTIAAGIANLSARAEEIGDWTADLPPKPAVSFGTGKLYGPKAWQRDLRSKLQAAYGKNAEPRASRFMAGAIASSDRLIKDPQVLFPWITTARSMLAVEMESAGVHRATRDKTPMISIRGLSDIVGLKRQEAWTKYACLSAAAFARGYLRTQPVSPGGGAEPSDGGDTSGVAPQGVVADQVGQDAQEEGFPNLILLRRFPETLFVAPSLRNTRQAVWAALNEDASGQPAEYVPNAWTIHEGNFYSLVDPELSRLGTVIDVGGIDRFEAREWAYSDDDARRRLFVQLLNRAIRDDLWAQGVRYHGDLDVFAFMGRVEEGPRRLKYPNLKLRSTTTVVSHYQSTSKDGKKFNYYRHNAVQGRFRWLAKQWYLEITPTYRFTYNGKDLDRFHENRLSGIKRIEKNRSVLSQLLIWQAVLRAPWTRVDRPRLLEFAPLESFRFARVDDDSLTPLDTPTVRPSSDRELDQ